MQNWLPEPPSLLPSRTTAIVHTCTLVWETSRAHAGDTGAARHALMHTHVHTNQVVETLTPTLVALLVETPERQIPGRVRRGGSGGGPPPPRPLAGTAGPHQTNSLHTEQKVGCLKKVAMNSWFLM